MLELAHGGSLFLDEIGELAPSVQAKLLKVLEDKQIPEARRDVADPRGRADHRGRRTRISSGPRGPAASARDLFYRLNVMPLVIPPLRRRRDEILPLALDFLEEFGVRAVPRRVFHLTPEAEAALQTYAWPGNIRELKNVMERAILLAKAT